MFSMRTTASSVDQTGEAFLFVLTISLVEKFSTRGENYKP